MAKNNSTASNKTISNPKELADLLCQVESVMAGKDEAGRRRVCRELTLRATDFLPDLDPVFYKTNSQLAKQFPINTTPFAIWYYLPEDGTKASWVINDAEGEPVYASPSYEAAKKLARAIIFQHQCDVDDALLKLSEARGVIDLVVSLSSTGDIQNLNEHSLTTSLYAVLGRIDEVEELLLVKSEETEVLHA